MGESPNETPDPLDSAERALHHAMAAGRAYAGEFEKRARRWLIWLVAAVALGLLALIGLVFFLAGVAEFIQQNDMWRLWNGGGKLLVGLALMAFFLLFLAFRGGSGKR